MGIYNRQVKQSAAEIAKLVVSYINAGGMIIGIIAANLSDVIFGGIMLGILFKDINILFGPPTDGWTLGFIVSFAFWFIQMLMWQMIFEDDTISKKDAIPLILALIVAIADTNIDVAPLFMWIEVSEIAVVLKGITLFGSYTLYNLTITSVIVGFYVVNGCSELFNAWYLRRINGRPSFKRKPKTQSQPAATQSRRSQLQQQYPSK